MKTKQSMLAAVLVLGFAAAPMMLSAPVASAQASRAATSAETITARVNGMVCDFCAQSVKKVFGKEAGVTDVAVNLKSGTIAVTLAPGATLGDDTIKALVKKSGYALVSIERSRS
ncbi:heavy-metal-associated domain-containing protein [bacterium]|nr:heavy-metal-associated domain-containing protein [bacterium]